MTKTVDYKKTVIHPTKLNRGGWGVRVDGNYKRFRAGDVVEVVKRNGKKFDTRLETQVFYDDKDDMAIWATSDPLEDARPMEVVDAYGELTQLVRVKIADIRDILDRLEAEANRFDEQYDRDDSEVLDKKYGG